MKQSKKMSSHHFTLTSAATDDQDWQLSNDDNFGSEFEEVTDYLHELDPLEIEQMTLVDDHSPSTTNDSSPNFDKATTTSTISSLTALFAHDDDNGDDSGSSDERDGLTILIEAKIQAKCSNTEHNVHPSKASAVPSILFDKYSFIVTIYDCKKEFLLVSDKIPISRHGHFSQSGLPLVEPPSHP